MLYIDQPRKQALKIIQNIDRSIKSFYVILESDWETLKSVYLDQWKNGSKKPVLPKIDLQLYEEVKPHEEDKSVEIAKEYFGNKVLVKE